MEKPGGIGFHESAGQFCCGGVEQEIPVFRNAAPVAVVSEEPTALVVPVVADKFPWLFEIARNPFIKKFHPVCEQATNDNGAVGLELSDGLSGNTKQCSGLWAVQAMYTGSMLLSPVPVVSKHQAQGY